MLCPHCLNVMSCISAINAVPGQSGRSRMDLHCVTPGNYGGRGCGKQAHVGVITEDPKKWICHEYNFEFHENGKVFYLKGYDEMVDPMLQHRLPGDKTILIERKFLPFQSNEMWFENILVECSFLPISTEDDMHEDAIKLFHKLKSLIVFS